MSQDRNILVSVITVCYNSSNTIARTVESILRQSYENIEYIIIDGASTDNTVEIVDGFQGAFKQKFNRPILVVSEPDQGIYNAMNKGIKLANGTFIGILNSDDTYEPDAVSRVIRYASDNPLQICYGAIKIYEENRLESIVFLTHEFMEQRMIAHPACFISKKVYEKFGTFNERYESAADYEFMLRVYDKEEITFTKIYEPLANFYLGGKSTTCAGYQDKLKMLYETGRMKRWEYICRSILLKFQSWFGGK